MGLFVATLSIAPCALGQAGIKAVFLLAIGDAGQNGGADERMWREKVKAIHDQMAQIDEASAIFRTKSRKVAQRPSARARD